MATLRFKTITWRDAGYGFENGFVGNVQMFQVGYDGTVAKGQETNPKPYSTTTQLPGLKRQTSETMDGAKKMADQLLKFFVQKICMEEV